MTEEKKTVDPIERLNDSFINKVRQLYGKRPDIYAVMFALTDDEGEPLLGRLIQGEYMQVAALFGSVIGIMIEAEDDPTDFFQMMAQYCAAQRGEIEMIDDVAFADGSAEITDEEIERVKLILARMKEEGDEPV